MTNDRNAGGGGMTGATGDLTPDHAAQRPFVPAETREVADLEQPAEVTEAQGGGGMASEDPGHARRDPDIGGDERADHEAHF